MKITKKWKETYQQLQLTVKMFANKKVILYQLLQEFRHEVRLIHGLKGTRQSFFRGFYILFLLYHKRIRASTEKLIYVMFIYIM